MSFRPKNDNTGYITASRTGVTALGIPILIVACPARTASVCAATKTRIARTQITSVFNTFFI
ncbi:hypothetical protein SCIP_0795 [Scardovia inopinata JCM 12537]|nr:hypothetical protein SCIP_0795 [Scardovia inopinata JCM 12537]